MTYPDSQAARWSCDFKRGACRNPHGCHCAEIEGMQRRLAALQPVPVAKLQPVPIADSVRDWHPVCNAAYERACLSDPKAAKSLRPAMRAIIEAAMNAVPPFPAAAKDVPLTNTDPLVKSTCGCPTDDFNYRGQDVHIHQDEGRPINAYFYESDHVRELRAATMADARTEACEMIDAMLTTPCPQ